MARVSINISTGAVTELPDLPIVPKIVEVPTSIGMRQARLALLGAGLLTQVSAALDTLPEPAQTMAKIEWEYSTYLTRDNPFVQQLIPLLGLTNTTVDQLFITAATL